MNVRQPFEFEQVLQFLHGDEPLTVTAWIIQLTPWAGHANIHELLVAVWEGDRASFPDLNWAVLQQQLVRVGVARVLGGQTNDPRYRDYILEVLEHASAIKDRLYALAALGAIGREEDLDRLQSVATGSDEELAIGALAGLFASKRPGARLALERLADDPSLSEQVRGYAAGFLPLSRPPE